MQEVQVYPSSVFDDSIRPSLKERLNAKQVTNSPVLDVRAGLELQSPLRDQSLGSSSLNGQCGVGL